MSDRTSAAIFAELFCFAAQDPVKYAELSRLLWSMTQHYDFAYIDYPREVVNALGVLGHARICWDSEYASWRVVFRGEHRFDTARPYDPTYPAWTPPDRA